MQHLHTREYIERGKTVVVELDIQANVMLMSDSDYRNYKSGGRYNYYGGHAKTTPVKIPVPSNGNWNVVIDLGGGSGRISHSIRIV